MSVCCATRVLAYSKLFPDAIECLFDISCRPFVVAHRLCPRVPKTFATSHKLLAVDRTTTTSYSPCRVVVETCTSGLVCFPKAVTSYLDCILFGNETSVRESRLLPKVNREPSLLQLSHIARTFDGQAFGQIWSCFHTNHFIPTLYQSIGNHTSRRT